MIDKKEFLKELKVYQEAYIQHYLETCVVPQNRDSELARYLMQDRFDCLNKFIEKGKVFRKP